MAMLPHLRKMLLASSLLIAPALSLSAMAAPDTPAPHAATAMESAVKSTLPNGLRVVIVPDRLAPVVQTQVIYLTGSAAAPEGFPGTAHALEHMMFNGSKALSRDQLSTVSARIGNVSNAFTTEDTTQFYFQAPAHYLDLLLKIEADRMRNILLTDADWTHERGAIEQEVARDVSMPFERYLIAQNRALFAGTSYEHDALGTRESFDKTDARLLRSFYDSWYQPITPFCSLSAMSIPRPPSTRYAASSARSPLVSSPHARLSSPLLSKPRQSKSTAIMQRAF